MTFHLVPPREHTERGFGVNTFEDAIGQECSFQDSSLASEAAVWLGVDVNCAKVHVSNRMHLTTDMIEGLVPIFEGFIAQTPKTREVENILD